MSELAYQEGERNVFFINLAWIIEASHLNEQKSKAAQHGTQMLMQMGVKPHMLVCRSENPVERGVLRKLAQRLRLPERNVIDLHTQKSVYQVLPHLASQNVDELTLRFFDLPPRPRRTRVNLAHYLQRLSSATERVVVGLAGKYLGPRDTYASILSALEHAGCACGVTVEVVDVSSDAVEHAGGRPERLEAAMAQLDKLDGLIVPGGFGRRAGRARFPASPTPAPAASRCWASATAFRRRWWSTRASAATWPGPIPPRTTPAPPIRWYVCCRSSMRSKASAARCVWAGTRFRCRTARGWPACTARGGPMNASATVTSSIRSTARCSRTAAWCSPAGRPGSRSCRWPSCRSIRFFIGVQFHPEFTSRPARPNPLFRGFVEACIARRRAGHGRTAVGSAVPSGSTGDAEIASGVAVARDSAAQAVAGGDGDAAASGDVTRADRSATAVRAASRRRGPA